MWKKIIFSFLIGSMMLSCARNPVTGKRELSFMSEAQEKQMGSEYHPQIMAEYGEYKDAKLEAFVNEKGQKMAAISHRPELGFTFKVVDSPVVNAFAVPGGYVYFTRGIMAHFNNEAEFAGVLGHEIGHVTARHANEMQTKQIFTQLILIGGMIASETLRQFAEPLSQGAGMLLMKYSRDNESQSDKLGVEYSTEIGYNSKEMANFFNTLQRLSGEEGRLPTFLSTHPDPGDRFNNVKSYTQLVHESKGIKPADLKINRNEYLRLIDGILHGEDPRQGYFENNMFYHPELKFSFKVPANWNKQNSPQSVQMAPEDGKALIRLTLAAGTDPNTAAQNFIKENGLSVIESSSNPVNGLQTVAIVGDIVPQAEQGQQQAAPLSLIVYFIKYKELIYQMVGVSAKADFNAYANTFRNTLTSFSVLSDQSKINVLPTRIKIVSARRNYTLQEGLQDYGMLQSKYNELALLNGMLLTDQIQSGTLFKVLESRN
jgi:predicted Zn-dependent protease